VRERHGRLRGVGHLHPKWHLLHQRRLQRRSEHLPHAGRHVLVRPWHHVLRRLGDLHPEWHLLHERRLPDRAQDHLPDAGRHLRLRDGNEVLRQLPTCSAPGGSCMSYRWVQGGWGACDANCGGGTQTQTVVCEDQNNAVVADAKCTSAKPPTMQACNTLSCGPYCTAAEYPTQSGTCPDGTETIYLGTIGCSCGSYDPVTGNGSDCGWSFFSQPWSCKDGSMPQNVTTNPGQCPCYIIIR
jgi:hypothetical protein